MRQRQRKEKKVKSRSTGSSTDAVDGVPYQSFDKNPTRFLFLLHRPTAHLLFLWQGKEKEDGGLETACTCESARLTVSKNQLHFLCYCFAHRRGVTIPGHFMSANRAASSKQPRFIRHRRRFGCFHQFCTTCRFADCDAALFCLVYPLSAARPVAALPAVEMPVRCVPVCEVGNCTPKVEDTFLVVLLPLPDRPKADASVSRFAACDTAFFCAV